MIGYGIDRTGFRVGMPVRVIKQNKYKKYDFTNRIGIIQYGYCASSIAVAFDEIMNDLSEKGIFYFRAADLAIVDEETHDRFKEDNNMEKIIGYFNAVKVKFIGDSCTSRYIYANFNQDVEVGDLVVVKPAHHDIALARVEEILPDNTYETTREVINKVYTDAYNYRVKVREQAAALKAKMDERAKQLKDVALYQMLAKDDHEMASLLSEYQALIKK